MSCRSIFGSIWGTKFSFPVINDTAEPKLHKTSKTLSQNHTNAETRQVLQVANKNELGEGVNVILSHNIWPNFPFLVNFWLIVLKLN